MTPISGNLFDPSNHQISGEIEAFLIDRQARHLSPQTIKFYRDLLVKFDEYLGSIGVDRLDQLQATHVRQYMIDLATHRNPGGCHAAYRAIRAFLRWYSFEIDDPAYERMIRKIPAPKVNKQPLPGVTIEQIKSLLDTCDRSFNGLRDRAIITALLDTGLRRGEFLKLNIRDIDFKNGAIQVIGGKGDKDRTVFVDAIARREIVRYLRVHPNPKPNAPLWVIASGSRITAWGLREMFRRRSEKAGIPEPQIHDFRRAFAIESLRNGCDPVSLMHLMGHSDIKTTQVYLYFSVEDLRKAHESSSPADNL